MNDLGLIALTVKIAAASTMVITVPALALAAWSWRRSGISRAIVDAIALLPLILPPTAAGFLLLQLLGRRSLIGATLQRAGIQILFTQTAAVIAAAVMSFPLMFVMFRSAIDSTEMRYFQIARTLGATPARAFLRVTLPLAWRGLVAGVLLSFCRAIGEFGATVMIAGNIPDRTQTLALAIYQRVESGRDAEGRMLVVYAVLLALTSLIVSELLISRQRKRTA
ncbi:MAG: molybdate ABC transporter permease subunit [Thermoanaerobaculia bacterium]